MPSFRQRVRSLFLRPGALPAETVEAALSPVAAEVTTLPTQPPTAPASKPKSMWTADVAMRAKRPASSCEPINPFLPAQPMPGVVPKGRGLAMDSFEGEAGGWAYAQMADVAGGAGYGFGAGLTHFPGYPYLAALSQIVEYRRGVEALAGDAVRKWGQLKATGGEDKAEKIDKISAEMHRLGVRSVFKRAAEQDGFFGRGHIFIDFDASDAAELMTNIGDGSDSASKEKVGPKRPIKALRTVEALWTYPATYDSTNPLSPSFYNPLSWFVQGQQVHGSRLLTLVSRPVTNLLKPAYGFGGQSLTQLAEPYVTKWKLAYRDVSDLLRKYNTSVLETDMASVLTGGADDPLSNRINTFTGLKDNFGVLAIDKASEGFEAIQVQLSGLDKLQAQAQEHICSAIGVPLVKFTGISPTGLNASSDGEMRAYYDTVASLQEEMFRPALTTIINLIQLSLFGEVDHSIGFEFEHLWSLDAKQAAEVREIDARTDETLIRAGVVLRSECRSRVAGDKGTPYAGLDLSKDIPLPEGDRVDIATKRAAAVIAAHEAGLTSEAVALQGLADTGLFPEITPAMIAEADQEPPVPNETDPVPDPLRSAERLDRLSPSGSASHVADEAKAGSGGLVTFFAAQRKRRDSMALDRASVRQVDVDGHLHVSRTPVSKANVCEYWGWEVVDYQGLGLDRNKVYRLYRDPDALKAAASTFDGKPLLFGHKPVSADNHPHLMVVGAVTDPVYQHPYLYAALDVWDGKAIRAIEDGTQKELSSGYRYRAVMQPGKSPEGESFDGRMVEIVCNHVSLVEEGRAGSDVVVQDGVRC